MKRYPICGVFILTLLICTCVSMPKTAKSPYDQWHYTYTILLDPDKPINSPQLDIALSLLYIKDPPEQAEYLNELLYASSGFDEYKDRIVEEHRKIYRGSMSDKTDAPAGKDMASYNWRYAESVTLKSSEQQYVVIERSFDSYSGGAHGMKTKRYYVLDLNERKQLKINDFLPHYQEDKRLRDIIYFELGKYGKLKSGQKLSEGFYFSNEPELSFNFFISSKGLGLHWDPYQIAPYVNGNIEIILPWQVIRPMLLTENIELLAKFGIYLFV